MLTFFLISQNILKESTSGASTQYTRVTNTKKNKTFRNTNKKDKDGNQTIMQAVAKPTKYKTTKR